MRTTALDTVKQYSNLNCFSTHYGFWIGFKKFSIPLTRTNERARMDPTVFSAMQT